MSIRLCCVPQCNSIKNENNSFHIFPKDILLREKWLKALKMKYITPSMKVCSNHFTRENFYLPEYRTQRMKLKKGSIPSRNIPTTLVLKQVQGNSRTTQARSINCIANRSQRIIEATETISSIPMNTRKRAQVATGDENTANESNGGLRCERRFEITKKVMLDKGVPDRRDTTDISKITVTNFIVTNSQLNAFTGIASFKLLDRISESVENVEKTQNRSKKFPFSTRERIILTLIKLKTNMTFSCLATLMRTSRSASQKCFSFTIKSLREILSGLVRWPDKNAIMRNMPQVFKKYSSTRVILDCTRVPIAQPTCSKCQSGTYSRDKRNHTVKYLIGTTPSGMVSFLSSGYSGRLSNKKIFLKSKILEKVSKDDSIIAVKDFIENSELKNHDINILRLPVPSNKSQLSPEEADEAANITAARAHVKRVTQRIRKFRIFNSSVPCDLVSHTDSILTIICGLSNLSPLILARNEFI